MAVGSESFLCVGEGHALGVECFRKFRLFVPPIYHATDHCPDARKEFRRTRRLGAIPAPFSERFGHLSEGRAMPKTAMRKPLIHIELPREKSNASPPDRKPVRV